MHVSVGCCGVLLYCSFVVVLSIVRCCIVRCETLLLLLLLYCTLYVGAMYVVVVVMYVVLRCCGRLSVATFYYQTPIVECYKRFAITVSPSELLYSSRFNNKSTFSGFFEIFQISAPIYNWISGIFPLFCKRILLQITKAFIMRCCEY